MTLIPKSTTVVDQMCDHWAAILYEALLTKHKIQKKPSLVSWSKTLSVFTFRCGYNKPPHEIEDALKWYCKHIGEQYVPQAYSAKGFVQKFDAIKAAMARDVDEGDEPEKITPELIDRAMLVTRICGIFPVEIAAALPAIIRGTEANWLKFCERMETCGWEGSPPRERTFLQHIVSMQNQWIFVNHWFDLLHQKHGFKKHYTGRIADLIFKPDSKLFLESIWRQWAIEYCGQPRAFDSLLEKLNND